MSTFIITYDLSKPLQNYPGVTHALESYDFRYHMMQSTWFVVSSETAEDIANKMDLLTDEDDKVFVTRVVGDSAWKDPSSEGSAWLCGTLNGPK